MTTARRLQSNFGLQYAVQEANKRKLPVVIFEALRSGYRWANKRHHTFILEGMEWNARAAKDEWNYHAWVETPGDSGKELLASLGKDAALVVTDEYPCFFLPRMIERAARKLSVALFTVDSNGVIPLQSTERHYTTAHSFRRFVQKTIPTVIEDLPVLNPLSSLENKSAVALPEDCGLSDPEEVIQRALNELEDLGVDNEVTPGSFVADEAQLSRNSTVFWRRRSMTTTKTGTL